MPAFQIRSALCFLHDELGLSDRDIAVLLRTSRQTVCSIRSGKLTGAYLSARVEAFMNTLGTIWGNAKRPARR